MDRDEILGGLRAHPEVSVLIAGAGINGIGTFRDLAHNGVDVLLIDRGDFCSGASAASSHMAHGGVRYLENGEFRLVREAVQERNRLIRNAPHLVKPLPTTIPIFRTFSGLLNAPLKFLGLLDKPSERGAIVIKVGLLLYDAYTGAKRVVPRHRFMDRRESLNRWDRLNPAVIYTATYFDGAILQPERLGLELILDAEAQAATAKAINYVSLIHANGSTVTLRDELTATTYEVKPKLLINATGPWIDRTNEAAGRPTKFIGGTKGSHLVLDHKELRKAIGHHEFFFENQDGRIVLIFPLYDRVLIGTSDIPVEDADTARCTEDEVDYFLDLTRRVFPSIKVTRGHIVFRFSGVRPLAASKSKTTGQITRDHEIEILQAGDEHGSMPIHSLVGGKWTSFRAFAEQATDRALGFLGRTRVAGTGDLAIGGGRRYPDNAEGRERWIAGVAGTHGLSAQRAEELFERYGTRADMVAEFLAAGKDTPLANVPGYSRREIGFLTSREKVIHLDDLLLRRSMLAMLGHVSRAGLAEISNAASEALGWDRERNAAELQRCLAILEDQHQVNL
jgi:glycerol-3-phosphate dehydrogenase